jgi:hypothetical protein
VPRAGLNTKLSYTYGGKTYTFDLRVQEVAFGSQMVAGESQARTHRAYYPHQVSAVPFSIVPILKGYNERTLFSNYLSDYVRRMQDPNLSVSSFPTIKVSMPNRRFLRWGVPVAGIEWGDHVGSMVWTPRVVFETHVDQSLGDTPGSYQWVSYFKLDDSAVERSPQIKYFYPAGVQLSGSQVPDSAAYDKVTTIQDIQDIINGGTTGPADAGDVDPNWGGVPYAPGQGGSSIWVR